MTIECPKCIGVFDTILKSLRFLLTLLEHWEDVFYRFITSIAESYLVF